MSTSAKNQECVISESVRFRLAGGQNPLILVPVHVDDKGPYEFILDTGASHCLLSPGLSEVLGVRPEIEKQAMGAAGPVRLAFAHVASLAVGSTRQYNVRVGITDELRRIGAAIGSRVDGGLGFEFVKDFSLTIDYHIRALWFGSPSETCNGRDFAHLIPFKLAATRKPLILVQVIVNDQGPFQFALDTGASRTMLSSDLAAKLALETVEDAPITGAGGQIRILAAKVNSLAVGDAIVRDHAIGVGEFLATLSAAAGVKLDGILGYNFLNRFRVSIVYPRGILELVPAVSNEAPGARRGDPARRLVGG
jgi:predicted aspartyl protease